MPKIYRVMKQSEDGKPIAGSGFCQLGVRPQDVRNNPPGEVHPGKGGMSVQPSLEALANPRYWVFLPERLATVNPTLFRGATGNNANGFIWTMGEGPFIDSTVSDNLALRCDFVPLGREPLHGELEPIRVMTLGEFQDALAQTRDEWKKEEI